MRRSLAGRFRLITAAILGMALVMAGPQPTRAQTTDNAGVEGRVVDESGGALPGATVTLTSPALQVSQLTTTTDASGHYRFAGLPLGTYSLSFQLSGFQTFKREALKIASGFVATVDANMKLGQMETSIVVTGESPVVDVRGTTRATNITDELIASLPTSRSIEEIAKLAPGTRVSGVPDVGGSHTGGGRGSVINYGSEKSGQTPMLEGVNTDGTSGYFDVGMLQEVQVRAGGADAEVATAGLSFQAISKTGGNQFHGELLAQYQNDGLQSDNVDDALRAKGVTAGNPMSKYHDLNAGFGGRLLPDKLWFYVSARDHRYVTRPLGFIGDAGPDGKNYTADDIPGETDNALRNYTAKVTAQPSPRHKLVGFYTYDNKHQMNRSGSAFKPHDTTGDYNLPNRIYKGEWTFIPNAVSAINVFAGRSYWKSREVPYTDAQSTFDTITQRFGGARVNSVGTDSTPAGSTSSRWQYNASYSRFVRNVLGGDHEIKVGAEMTREFYNKFQELRGAGTGGVGNDFRTFTNNGVPTEVLFFNTPFLSNNNVNNQSVYFKDSFRLSDRLTLNPGLRWERYHAYLPAQSKPAGPYSSAADYPRTELYDWKAIAPRLGISWALTESKKTVLKATFARFNFVLRASDSVTIRTFNKNDYSATRYRWNDLNGDKLYQPGERGAFLATEGGSSTIYRPIDQPKVNEATLFIEHELIHDLSVRAGYVYKKEFNLFQLVNLARPASVYSLPITTKDPGPDNILNNADDGGPVTYYDFDPAYAGAAFEKSSYVNTPGYADKFNNFEFSFQKRLSNKWQAIGSFLATKKSMWIAGVPQTPNEPFPKDETWDTAFRLSGSYQFPWKLDFGVVYEYQSGAALARDAVFRTGLRQLGSVTLRLEKVGSRRLDAVQLLNLRLAKRITIRAGHQVTLEGNVYNALNTNVPTTVSVRSGSSFGQISAIVPPRVARVGIKYTF